MNALRIAFWLSYAICLSLATEEKGFVKLQKYPSGAESVEVDTVVYIDETLPKEEIVNVPGLKAALEGIEKIDTSFVKKASVHPANLESKSTVKRIIFSPTGRLDSDVADSRSIYEAAHKAFTMGYKAGAKNILLLIGNMTNAPSDYKQEPWAEPKYRNLQALLGALYALYVPLEVRECCPERKSKYDNLYAAMAYENTPNQREEKVNDLDWAIKYANAIEEGRWVARDICGSDSERMSTANILEYLKNNTDLEKLITEVLSVEEAQYPLMAAVDRGNKGVTRHEGRVVKMAYGNNSTASKILLLVGKGITFDTGGYDLKVSGGMVGMHRDKCGAAALVGFLRTASILKPEDLYISAKLAFVRNALSARAYTVDEIITSRAGKRVRIGNTDAEGRMVMTDLIAEAKEEALGKFKGKDVQIITAATLTGHVVRCYKWITGAMENGPSKNATFLKQLRLSGDQISDMLEISALRKEDYDFNLTPLETEDYLQCNNAGSVTTTRGHQFPAAFMIQASGLDAHGIDSDEPIKFAHLDVAGSAGLIDTVPTAAPMTMLANHYLIKAKPTSS
ncbi:metalloexopeptidase activity [Sparganum proliferum]